VLGSTGGATTSFGVIYSTSSTFTSPTPITANINSNASAGTYTTTITGLSATTTYYVKAFATNTVGTTYGPTINFTTPVAPIAVGDSYGGGKVFYIFQPSDEGYYVANETHGLIAATVDQSTGIRWNNENRGNETTGATGTAIGTGKSNTTKITSVQGAGSYAAKICEDYTVTVGQVTYDDWYLPSRDELNKMYANIGIGIPARASSDPMYNIGGFTITHSTAYFSSSETGAGNAWYTFFVNGTFYPGGYDSEKTTLNNVRAIRSF
jgi:hypothetical protein